MKQQIFILCVLFWSFGSAFGQMRTADKIVDSLKYLSANAFDCHSVYWRIIGHRDEVILSLIAKISDKTKTKVKWECKKRCLRVGDLSFMALSEIVNLPLFTITGQQFDVINDNCRPGVYEYIEKNRLKFQEQVKKWYDENYAALIWVKFEDKYMTECRRQNNVVGYYTHK